MLGSRYNDSKERLENRRSSFFLTASTTASPHGGNRRVRSTGSSTVSPQDDIPSPATPPRRYTIAKTRSLDSGVRVPMSSEPFNANNPQDDYGSTKRTSFSSENETPLLAPSAGRSRSMICMNHRSSCADLPNIDEKPVSWQRRVVSSIIRPF